MKLLLIGSISNSQARYQTGIKFRFGGGVRYGAEVAIKLGVDTEVLTIGCSDIDEGVAELVSLGVKVTRVERESSNNFSNDYTGTKRESYVRSFINKPIQPVELPADIRGFDGIILFPLLNEISPDILQLFPPNLIVMLDPTGFMRQLGERNKNGLYPVVQSNWSNLAKFVNRINILKLSIEDLAGFDFAANITTDEEKVQYLSELGFPLVIITRESRPVIVFGKDVPLTHIPVKHIEKVVDSAGAGEVFAVAFMQKYLQTNDPILGVEFAIQIASQNVALKNLDNL